MTGFSKKNFDKQTGPARPADPELPEAISPPWANYRLIGHQEIESEILTTHRAGRLPHALILTGPQGVGKASFAFRLARYLAGADRDRDQISPSGEIASAQMPSSEWDFTADHPICRQIEYGSYPDLQYLRRDYDPKKKKFKTQISAEQVRQLTPFFLNSASQDGGWKIAIIDACDDLNLSSANSLLKILEEPPNRSLLILITHQIGTLLPTLRSRCAEYCFHPLSDKEMQQFLLRYLPDNQNQETPSEELLALAQGRPGKLLRLLNHGALPLYRNMLRALSHLPTLNAGAIQAVTSKASARKSGIEFALFADLFSLLCERLVTAHCNQIIGTNSLSGAEKNLLSHLRKTGHAKRQMQGKIDVTGATLHGFWRAGLEVSNDQHRLNLDPASSVLTLFNRCAEIMHSPFYQPEEQLV